jgi:hypothetical protein
MSTPAEQLQAIKHAVFVSERRLKELDARPQLTRAELYERDMVVDCIQRGKKILASSGVPLS